MNRHGLIAGATGTGQDQDAAADGRGGCRRPACRCSSPTSRATSPGWRRRATPRREGRERARRRPASAWRPAGVPGRAPEPERQAGRAAARDGVVVRAAGARQGAGPQRHAGERAVAGVQVLRRPPAAAARLQGPARGAQPPDRRGRGARCATTAASRRRRSACCCARWWQLEQQGARRVLRRARARDRRSACERAPDGRGRVSVLELSDVQDKPALFSTFMMWMLARALSPAARGGRRRQAEAGVLLRRGAPAVQGRQQGVPRPGRAGGAAGALEGRRHLLRHAEPEGRPGRRSSAQLGNRVQHALRAFTPDDEKALRAAARTFPKTPFYDVEETLTTLGIGEALVTVLARERRPDARRSSPAIAPPASRMGPLTPAELAPLLRHRAGAALRDRRRPRERLRDPGRAHREPRRRRRRRQRQRRARPGGARGARAEARRRRRAARRAPGATR